jgi:hypothetical protein
MIEMETATENLPNCHIVGSPILSVFSRLGSLGSDSVGETAETHPPIYREPVRHHRVMHSSLSMPDLNNPPLFEIYVRKRQISDGITELKLSDVVLGNADFHLCNNNDDEDENSRGFLSTSDCRSSTTCPTAGVDEDEVEEAEEEGEDEDGPHLLRWGSSVFTEEGERTASIQWEEDDAIESILVTTPHQVTPNIRRKQIVPSEALQTNDHQNNHNRKWGPTSKKCSRGSPRSIHSFFDPILNMLGRKKGLPREPPEMSDLHVPDAVSCSYDLSDGVSDINPPKYFLSPKCM